MQILVLNIPVSPSPINPLGEVTHLIKLITREPELSEMNSTRPVYFTRCKDGSWGAITEDFAACYALREIFKNAEKSTPVESIDDEARRAVAAL